ncbi:uncharacterized protein BDW47DRAFT_127708 [Aspergillus candidus]|uniref:Uncharacterized protein n=1 Tax=Aspergillus candidus TaxID=41067 RepID=A0A2I2F5T3_ASPCN|nr:hypothetical protein BDW47DRAFT_127708 [Aspergillus candidus]PLB35971.1 hypothetical protein BDW47DRAFT_127708 [Aspergillus candidus]
MKMLNYTTYQSYQCINYLESSRSMRQINYTTPKAGIVGLIGTVASEWRCIYHLIFAIQDARAQAERTLSIKAFKLSYQLPVRFSHTLDTAKRATRALDWAVFTGEVGSLFTIRDGAYFPTECDVEDHLPTRERTAVSPRRPQGVQISGICFPVA